MLDLLVPGLQQQNSGFIQYLLTFILVFLFETLRKNTRKHGLHCSLLDFFSLRMYMISVQVQLSPRFSSNVFTQADKSTDQK